MLLVCFQDVKFNAIFKADRFNVKATDFYLEPLATFLCVGTGREEKAGDAPVDGAGGGYASQGGGGMASFLSGPNSLARFLCPQL